VTIAGTDGSGGSVDDCTGEPFVFIVDPGELTVSRPADAVTDALTVTLSYDGDPDLTDTLPTEVVIPAGEASASIEVDGDSTYTDSTVTATVSTGDGYAPGDPATATVEFPGMLVSDLACMFKANATISEVTPVGAAPSTDLADAVDDLRTDGIDGAFVTDDPLPPGLSVDEDGVWSGAATTVGVYEFTGFLCDLTEFCGARIEVRIEVANATTASTTPVTTTTRPASPSTAPAATPVRATATYTG
jgi:hypothetical protein